MKILVTGSAGFIGFFLIKALLKGGNEVIGIDNLNDYYSVQLKKDRLEELERFANSIQSHAHYQFIKLDFADRVAVAQLFEKEQFDKVVHLGAQAGVRYSIDNPYVYADSNLMGFVNILEGCRHSAVEHLVYASSSSVYGMNNKQPFAVSDRVDYPISLYAATKKSNELMAHAYSHLYNVPMTGLRFFTVYGPWGRPDMAYFKFTESILAGKPIDVYNQGKMQRDFTYIDDIVEGVTRVLDNIPSPQHTSDTSAVAPYKVYNIGNNQPVELGDFIQAIEEALGKKAVKNLLPMQPGDVQITYADVDDLIADTGFKPSTDIREGLNKFVSWYISYYQKKAL